MFVGGWEVVHFYELDEKAYSGFLLCLFDLSVNTMIKYCPFFDHF